MENGKKTTAILCAIIVGVSILLAACGAALIVRDREMSGSFSGVLNGGGGYYNGSTEPAVLMDLYELRDYLALEPDAEMLRRAEREERQAQFPTTTQANNGDMVTQGVETTQSVSNADDLVEQWLLEELEKNITSGKWPGFPYVKIGKAYYFNKTAVDNWFAAQGEKQLEIK